MPLRSLPGAPAALQRRGADRRGWTALGDHHGKLEGRAVAAGRHRGADTRFAALLDTAIVNADIRDQLTASRARIVATTDATRRRFERDLHDGAQQRLVSLSLVLRDAQATIPQELEESHGQLARVAEGMKGVLDGSPRALAGHPPGDPLEGGLGPALKALARRSAVPVKLDLRVDGRLEEHLEVTAYYVASEALANTAKHAQASMAEISRSS